MSNINVKDYFNLESDIRESKDTEPVKYADVIREKPFEVGEFIYIPYKVTEINTKMAGDDIFKQLRLEGPTIDPSREVYTEHRLRDVFCAV